MRTPEEIKRGLVSCAENGQDCAACPYRYYVGCMEMAIHDALAYIESLEAGHKLLIMRGEEE